MAIAFKPSVAGLDIKPDKPTAKDKGREKSRSTPGINRARVYRVALGDLRSRRPEYCVGFVGFQGMAPFRLVQPLLKSVGLIDRVNLVLSLMLQAFEFS